MRTERLVSGAQLWGVVSERVAMHAEQLDDPARIELQLATAIKRLGNELEEATVIGGFVFGNVSSV